MTPEFAAACITSVLAAAEVQDRHGGGQAARAEAALRKRSEAARRSRRERGEPAQIAKSLGLADDEIAEWNRIRLKKFSAAEAADIIIRSRRAVR